MVVRGLEGPVKACLAGAECALGSWKYYRYNEEI
jgi:hypothetical protein